jgi:hypothetical protein
MAIKINDGMGAGGKGEDAWIVVAPDGHGK